MPKVPEAPKADLEPDAKAAEAEVAKEPAGAEENNPKGNYSDADILDWIELELTHADKVCALTTAFIAATPLQVVEMTSLATRCADVYFAGDRGLEQLRSLVQSFGPHVPSMRWPSMILKSVLQAMVTRGIGVHETSLGITL